MSIWRDIYWEKNTPLLSVFVSVRTRMAADETIVFFIMVIGPTDEGDKQIFKAWGTCWI